MSERSHTGGVGPNPGTAPAPQDLPPPPAGQLTTQLHGLALDLQLQSQSQLPPPSQQPEERDAPSPMDNIPTPGAQRPGPGPSSGAASPTSTHTASCPSRVWIPDIVDRIAAFLPPNEIPASVRLVNRATASQFRRDRRHVTIVATEPVPPHAFKRQWGHPGGGAAVRALSRGSRHLLVTATARTGVLENLQALLAWEQYFPATCALMADAAAGGHVGVCEWLRREAGCPLPSHCLPDVVWRGDEAMAMWLIRAGCPYLDDDLRGGGGGGGGGLGEYDYDDDDEYDDSDLGGGENFTLPAQAARGGHRGLMERLCQLQPASAIDGGELVRAAAEGLPLAALQELHTKWIERRRRRLEPFEVRLLVSAAALSPTPDWADKLRWLLHTKSYERFGDTTQDPRDLESPRSPAPGGFIAPHLFCQRVEDVGARIRELSAWPGATSSGSAGVGTHSGFESGFGFGLTGDHLILAAERGDADLMQYVLALFGPESRRRARTSHSAVRASRAAARSGHLRCLQVLLAAGCLPGSTDQAVAAAATAEAAAKAATADAMRRGGGNGDSGGGGGGHMDDAHDVLAAAAASGRLEVLEWVAAAQGVEEDGIAPPPTSTAAGGLAAAQVAAAAAPAAEAAAAAAAAAAAGERPQRRRRSYLLRADLAEEAVAGSGRHGAATGEARAMLTWLRSRGCAWGPAVMSRAINCGDRELCEWLAAAGCPLDGGAVTAAASLLTGAVEVAAWAQRRGAPLSAAVFREVAAAQNEALLTWLAAAGCPMPADGSPYLRPAMDGHWPTLRCLRRLGCSFGTFDHGLFAAALMDPSDYLAEQDAEADNDFFPQYDTELGPAGARLAVLKWLAEEGCPLLPAAMPRPALRRESAADAAAETSADAKSSGVGPAAVEQVEAEERVAEAEAAAEAAVDQAMAVLLRRAEYRRPWAPDIHTWLVKHLAQLRLQQQQQQQQQQQLKA